VERSSPRIFATSVIVKNMPKENNHKIGENSPNLVTLLKSSIAVLREVIYNLQKAVFSRDPDICFII
jgi:hypothetical protein